MKTALTVLVFCLIILCSGCFLRFNSEGIKLEAGSTYPPCESLKGTTSNETQTK